MRTERWGAPVSTGSVLGSRRVIHRRGAAPTALGEVLLRERAIGEALLYAATRHAQSEADAEDLVQETLRIALARSDPPDAADLDAVRRFLGSILNGVAANARRAKRRHPASVYDDDVPPSSSRGVPSPERALAEREEEASRQQAKADLRAHLAGEPIALRMWDLAEEGVRGSAEMAQRIGCSVAEVYNAQRRITYHARRLRDRAVSGERRAS
jgi:DNA-directed RNA polymerase specialized sigma24 family protein